MLGWEMQAAPTPCPSPWKGEGSLNFMGNAQPQNGCAFPIPLRYIPLEGRVMRAETSRSSMLMAEHRNTPNQTNKRLGVARGEPRPMEASISQSALRFRVSGFIKIVV